jgi:hypothetical protein
MPTILAAGFYSLYLKCDGSISAQRAEYPNLKRLALIRLSIDHQTGQLDGNILNSQDESLARIKKACEASAPEGFPKPKF